MHNDLDTLRKVGLDPDNLGELLSFYEITQADLDVLASLHDWAEQYTPEIVDALYEHFLGHPRTAAYLVDPDMVARLRRTQARYFLDLFKGTCDAAYMSDRVRVGRAHERIGLPPHWYLGAYSRYLRQILVCIREHLGADDPRVLEGFQALMKLVFLDASIAIDVYISAHVDTLQRHQAAIRELSTPVILVHDEVLLLPLVGTVDSHRAQQIMETVLREVSKNQAQVIILDIAGVPVVDTQVADYLLRATAAVRLLGARTILTGISPQVARTIVELGVDISTMATRHRLADGVELALSWLGRRVVEEHR